ncbi:hypothetical protein M3Y99_01300500 [Aphelenchoides fujianensis]|nr:hypothetical protein M3Y99_01300500 [Aphelenchoides fujianensis]
MRPLSPLLFVLLLEVPGSSTGRFLFDRRKTAFDSCSAIGWNREFGEYAAAMSAAGTTAASTSASTSATSERPQVEETTKKKDKKFPKYKAVLYLRPDGTLRTASHEGNIVFCKDKPLRKEADDDHYYTSIHYKASGNWRYFQIEVSGHSGGFPSESAHF